MNEKENELSLVLDDQPTPQAKSTDRPDSESTCPSMVSSGGYPQSVAFYPYPPPPPSSSTSSAPYGYARSHVALTEQHPSYSPVPLIDYPNLVDFRDPVFVEAVETNQLHMRLSAQLPWVRINLSFRSVRLGDSTMTELNPFVVRECDFILRANQTPFAVPVKFQPIKGGSYTAFLEVQVGYHDQYNRPVSQTHTVNVIGKAIEPNIAIDNENDNDDIDIGCSSQLVPIYNHSEFDVPVMIEIDHGFTMTIQGHITNKIRIRAKTHVMCSIAPYNGGAGGGGNEQLGKLKVMLDRRDTPVVLKWKLLKKIMIVVDQIDLAGPLERIKLTGQIHQECSVRIPIRNLSTSSMASMNATIDGMYAESMSLAPEMATVPPNGELVFSIKYTPAQNHQSLEHKLIIEVSGAEREFVFAFFTVVEHKKLQHKAMDSIMANKSTLIFDGVDQGATKSVAVSGEDDKKNKENLAPAPKRAKGPNAKVLPKPTFARPVARQPFKFAPPKKGPTMTKPFSFMARAKVAPKRQDEEVAERDSEIVFKAKARTISAARLAQLAQPRRRVPAATTEDSLQKVAQGVMKTKSVSDVKRMMARAPVVLKSTKANTVPVDKKSALERRAEERKQRQNKFHSLFKQI